MRFDCKGKRGECLLESDGEGDGLLSSASSPIPSIIYVARSQQQHDDDDEFFKIPIYD